MHVPSPLLDTDGMTNDPALTLPPPPLPAGARPVSSTLRSLSVTFTPTANNSNGNDDKSVEPILLHVSFQGYLDALWVLVTEDTTCAPGVILCNNGLPEELRAASAGKYNGETPSAECEVLLGLRDSPLTNLVASSVAHVVRSFGEARALVMCVSVAKTAKVLCSTDDKRSFLALVRETVMELAKGGGGSH